MKQVMIKNAEGALISVDVVRYFRLNSLEYLIFSLNEIDEGGYAKLYVSKIVDGVGQSIEDDVEWNLIKDTIKSIIKSNKDNMPLSITDLNVSTINNMSIVDRKIFKLNDSLLQLLRANVSEESTFEVSEVNSNENNFTREVPLPEFNVFQEIANNVPNEIFNSGVESETTPDDTENNNSLDANLEYALDYKSLYENELRKNNELTQEIEKYKNRLGEIKSLIDQTM